MAAQHTDRTPSPDKWGLWYALVLGVLVLLIGLFTLFTNYFS
ncbi:MAG TPA: hypothetical protein VG870_02615 [Chitinophagaceae bacterium]|nr:hypothetical protein [Chitinophagaceae bacterium]